MKYYYWLCERTFIFKENEKGDTKFYRGQLLLLPEDESAPGYHPDHIDPFFRKLDIGYMEPKKNETKKRDRNTH